METIQNYLESMFASLPNTPEVIKAKCELGQMMEDKYTELMAEGKSDNEAVGQVIAEFGNLDDLAEALGISHILHDKGVYFSNTRKVTEEEIRSYLFDATLSSMLRGLGVFLAIVSPCGVILAATLHSSNGRNFLILGLVFLFLAIAACVGLCTYSGLKMGKWAFLKREACSIDYSTTGMVNDARNQLHGTVILERTIAVILFCTCYIPLIVLCMWKREAFFAGIGVTILLFMVGIAVFILVAASGRENGYARLLRLNSRQKMEGYFSEGQRDVYYDHPRLQAFMSLYWPTVVCAYLIISFLTFSWAISWIIWPIAAIVNNLIHTIFGNEKGE